MIADIPLFREQELHALGLENTEGWTLLSQRHGHRIWRVAAGGQPRILKWLGNSPQRTEVCAYALLERLGVPTPRVYGRLPQALLLEDLAAGPCWRLAAVDDANDPAVGSALATWYRTLHGAGDRLRQSEGFPRFLARETDALTAESILATGQRLGLAQLAAWRLAAEAMPQLLATQRALPETLNYNDFALENLALSRGLPLQALVFDYGLLGIGPRYSDLRNVTSALGPRAAQAFLEGMPPADEREALLDAPLAALYSLQVAAELPQLPSWARSQVQEVTNGALEQSLRAALAIL